MSIFGCMQINWRWHGSAFDGVSDMLDPVKNTRYAARFLRLLHDRARQLGQRHPALSFGGPGARHGPMRRGSSAI